MRTKTPALRAITYSRSSTGKEKSIADQTAENRAVATDQGWTIAEELSDPVSASRYSKKVRANWQRVAELLPDVDVVILWEPSRGDRTLASWATWLDLCRLHGVLIHATSHRRTNDPRNARDYRSLAEDGVDSSYESDRLSQRVCRGNDSRVAQGKPLGQAAYGYQRQYDPGTSAYVCEAEHPVTGPIVRDLFASFAGGEPIAALVRRLHGAGVPTPWAKAKTPGNGRPASVHAPVWRASTLRKILMNRRYAPHPDNPERGTLVHRTGVHVGTWPPLVDAATWQAVQDRLGVDDPEARAARKWAKPGRIRHLLSGSVNLLRAPCGGVVAADPGQRRYAARYMCATDGCSTIAMHETDEFVIALLLDRLAKPQTRRLWAPDDTATRAARAELARLTKDLADNDAAYRTGTVSARLAGLREAELTPQVEDARRRAQPAGAPAGVVALLAAADNGDPLRPVWDDLTVLARREVVAAVFEGLGFGRATMNLRATMTQAERMDIVSARITHEWRKP